MTVAFWVSYALLWLLVVVLVVAVFALYHHFGQVYLGSPEGRFGQGPREGSLFRPVDAVDLAGRPVLFPQSGRPLLVVFASTTCPLCAQLRTALATFTLDHSDIDVAVFCDGRASAVQAWAGSLAESATVVVDRRGRIAVRNGVDGTPFCIAVGRDGIVRAKGAVNHLEALEALADEVRSLPIIETTHTHSKPEAEVTR